MQNQFSNFSTVVVDYQTKINDIESKLDDLENRSRRNNLVFDGVEEDTNETREMTENKLRGILVSKLQIETTNCTIERAHRVGGKARSRSKPRTIVAKFANAKTCSAILKGKKKFMGSNVHVYMCGRISPKRLWQNVRSYYHECKKRGEMIVGILDMINWLLAQGERMCQVHS